MPRRTNYGHNTSSMSYEESIDAYKVQFQYDESIITWFKYTIPASERSWNPDEKAWYIAAKYFDIVRIFLEAKTSYVTVFTKEDFLKFKEEQAKLFEEQQKNAKAMRSQVSIEEEWNKFKKLLLEAGLSTITTYNSAEDCEEEVARTLYRKASLKYHPDRNNGNGSKMAELNVVWKNLKEYHYAKETIGSSS